jgi:hypothetical protein
MNNIDAHLKLIRAIQLVAHRAWAYPVVATALVTYAAIGYAANTPEPINIDLSRSASEADQTVAVGTYQVSLTNLIIGKNYTVKTNLSTKSVTIPSPFTVPGGETGTPAPAIATAVSPCDQATSQAQTTLSAQTSEAQVRDLLDKNSTTGIAHQLSTAGCSSAEIAVALQKFVDATTLVLRPVTIQANQIYTVSITRAGAAGSTGSFGPYTFDGPTPAAGQWLTFYGFNFVRSGDQKFYSKQNSSPATTYTITQETNRSSTVFTPSVYFMWIPGEDTSWYPGLVGPNAFIVPVAGVGFDFSNPVVFLGYGVGWGYNVMVDFGVAAHKEERLLGQYNPGQTITSNLTDAQLTQGVYRPEVFVGVSFRFGSNPFQSSSSSQPKSPAKPASTPGAANSGVAGP